MLIVIKYIVEIAFFLLYYVIIKIIPFIVTFGLPLFFVGIIIGLLGVAGHIIFILLFAYAMYKYYDVVLRSVFNIEKKKKPKKNNLRSKLKAKATNFAKSLIPFTKQQYVPSTSKKTK